MTFKEDFYRELEKNKTVLDVESEGVLWHDTAAQISRKNASRYNKCILIIAFCGVMFASCFFLYFSVLERRSCCRGIGAQVSILQSLYGGGSTYRRGNCELFQHCTGLWCRCQNRQGILRHIGRNPYRLYGASIPTHRQATTQPVATFLLLRRIASQLLAA